MIISASRRTDIPALYSEWFMNRVRAGWCAVPNPVNVKQVSQVSLSPHDVDAIIFWSKNPAPMLHHLAELDRIGFRYYFQFSLNDYPSVVEPNIPTLETRVRTFLNLSQCIGTKRIVWRYDPIIISNKTPYEFHSERFARIAERLRGATNRVMISIVDYYQKTKHRLSQLKQEGFSFDRSAESSTSMVLLLEKITTIAKRHGMEIFTCAEEKDYSRIGIPPGRCIDESLLNMIWSLSLRHKKDPGQRRSCLCTISKDIGINDTCVHGCPYCYSTRNYEIAQRRHREHNSQAPILWSSFEVSSLGGV